MGRWCRSVEEFAGLGEKEKKKIAGEKKRKEKKKII